MDDLLPRRRGRSGCTPPRQPGRAVRVLLPAAPCPATKCYARNCVLRTSARVRRRSWRAPPGAGRKPASAATQASAATGRGAKRTASTACCPQHSLDGTEATAQVATLLRRKASRRFGGRRRRNRQGADHEVRSPPASAFLRAGFRRLTPAGESASGCTGVAPPALRQPSRPGRRPQDEYARAYPSVRRNRSLFVRSENASLARRSGSAAPPASAARSGLASDAG